MKRSFIIVIAMFISLATFAQQRNGERRERQQRDFNPESMAMAQTNALDKAVANFDQLTTLRLLMEDYEIKQMATEAEKRRVTEAVTTLADAEAELKAAWEAAGDVCPLCERPMGDDHMHE